jgi:hypothetical protein
MEIFGRSTANYFPYFAFNRKMQKKEKKSIVLMEGGGGV